MGEIYFNIDKWIYKHKRDLKRADLNNSLVTHDVETNQNFNFKDSKMLLYLQNKNLKNCLISNCKYSQEDQIFSICLLICQIGDENLLNPKQKKFGVIIYI